MTPLPRPGLSIVFFVCLERRPQYKVCVSRQSTPLWLRIRITRLLVPILSTQRLSCTRRCFVITPALPFKYRRSIVNMWHPTLSSTTCPWAYQIRSMPLEGGRCSTFSLACATLGAYLPSGSLLLVTDPRSSVDVDVDIPAIAAIGWQSAGKSSLIEAISGITLPRASGTCTRRVAHI